MQKIRQRNLLQTSFCFLKKCYKQLVCTLVSIYFDDQVYSNTRVSTRVNTSQHESTRVNTSLTRINTSPTRVNTNQHESDTNQHESETSQHESTRVQHESTQINTSPTRVNTNQHEPKTSLDHKKRINMAKQNPNVTYQWCFLEKYAESCIYQ